MPYTVTVRRAVTKRSVRDRSARSDAVTWKVIVPDDVPAGVMVNRGPENSTVAGAPPTAVISMMVNVGCRSGDDIWIVWDTEVPCLTSLMSLTTSRGRGAATTST